MDDAAHLAGRQDEIRQSQDMMDIMSDLKCGYKTNNMDQELSFRFVSSGFWNMLEYDSEQEFLQASQGTNLGAAYAPDADRIRALLAQQLAEGDAYRFEYRLKKKSGGVLWVTESGRRVRSCDGDDCLQGIVTDVTALKEAEAALRRDAEYDGLTGLYNKKAFYQKTADLLKQHPKQEFEIMCLDVERFKIINDLFGEKIGNRLLVYIADVIRANGMEKCAYGRLQSDDFVLCYPCDKQRREEFIRRIQNKIEQFPLDYKIIIGCGVYRVTNRSLSINGMCDRAMMAYRHVKGNYLVPYGEYDEKLRQAIVTEQGIVNEMYQALASQQFKVYLQPKYSLITESITGAEALVRWLHPQRGLIPPGEFIPVFERNGFIMKLDEYVWECTCQLLRKWLDEGMDLLPISVNISRFDLYNANLYEILTGLVEKYALDPKLLELELTESAYMENPQQIIDITKKLQSYGFVILMDDFGSGYSSLNMLKDVPVDILKIDLHFLDSTDDPGRGNNILNSVVRMAKWLDIPVITEGVETRHQAEFLRTIGCSYAQGYYYSRPIPVDAYEKLLAQTKQEKMNKKIRLDELDAEDIWDPSVQLSILFNSVNGSIGLYELNGGQLEAVRVNDGYFEMFGYAPENFYQNSRKIMDGIVAEDRSAVLDMLHEAAQHVGVAQRRIRHYRADGSIMWLHVRSRGVVKDGDSQLFYIAMEDITELQHKSLEVQAMFNNIPAGFGVYELEDDEIKICLQSQGMQEINGRSRQNPAQPASDRLSDFIGKPNMRKLLHEAKAAYDENRTMRLKYPFRRMDGTIRWAWSAANIVKNELSGKLRFYGVVNDITDSHLAEEGLRINEERANIVLALVKQDVWEYDIPNKQLYVKENLLEEAGSNTKMVAVTPEEIVKRGMVYPDYVNGYFAVYDRLRYGAETAEWLGPFKLDGGDYRWVHTKYQTIFDDRGRAIRAIGTHVNVTQTNAVADPGGQTDGRQLALGIGVIAVCKINLTADFVEDVESFHDLAGQSRKAESCDDLMALWAERSASAAEAEQFQQIFNRRRLLQLYDCGQKDVSHKWRVKDKNKKMRQLEISLRFAPDSDQGDLIAFGQVRSFAKSRKAGSRRPSVEQGLKRKKSL